MNTEDKFVYLDRISNLPSSIIENILCLVSLRDAVRTSILSKNWRYNWVRIPKLVFNQSIMFGYTTRENQLPVLEQSLNRRTSDMKQYKLTRTLKVFYAIRHVLILHQGPILEFSLSMGSPDATCVEILIDQLIIHLARNYGALKKFRLQVTECKFILPRSIFLLHQLTDLYIYIDPSFEVDFDPVSNGFGSLTSLPLMCMAISGKALLRLLSKCQLLKRFKLFHSVSNWLPNENVTCTELLNSLPMMIERLTFYHCVSENLFEYSDPRELPLPTALVHLKKFCLHDMILHDYWGLDLLCLVMRSSPNLKKIKLNVEVQHADCLEFYENSKIESGFIEKMFEYLVGAFGGVEDCRIFQHCV